MQPPLQFTWQRSTGAPIVAGGQTVTPEAQVLSVRWPGGGFVWNRPVALIVEKDGRTRRLSVIDLTRIVQIGLLSLAVAVLVLAYSQPARRKGNRHGN